MERVAVIGCGGSGKSWLSRRLSALTGLPLIHLDAEYWRGPELAPTPTGEWTIRHAELATEPRWILDGNYGGTMADRFTRADTVVFLDRPTIACLWGVLTRPNQGFARVNPEFLRYIWGYRRTRRPTILTRLAEFDGEAVILRDRREVTAWLTSVETCARR